MIEPSGLPRVSDILRATGLGPDYSAVPEARLEAARERGIARHAAIEAHHYRCVEPEQEAYLGGYLKFLAATGHVPVVSEFPLYYSAWGYRTQGIDRVGIQDGLLVMIDWKPWGTDLAVASYQLAAYAAAWEDSARDPIRHLLVVELTDDDYRMTDVTQPDPRGRWPGREEAWRVFQAAVIIYRAQRRGP